MIKIPHFREKKTNQMGKKGVGPENERVFGG